ncbi:MAG: tRNA pseudouridine(55) synthase TruB, partial [Actinomycetota bacterium]
VLIDKQQGWTSHDVVAKLRGILGTRKIGHAGTLDPMATGLLVLGVDGGTKLLQFISGSDKQYLATIRLGAATHTDDAEGEILSSASALSVTQEQIDAEIAKLTGEITQVPSSVSAIKVDGKRAYDLVRDGKEVELKGRKVTVSNFQRTSDLRRVGEYLDFDVLVDCTSGTYIRALARDIGAALGVGGHLTMLRRTKIGNFDLANATEMDKTPVPISLVDASQQLFDSLELNSDLARDIVHGKRISLGASSVVAATWNSELLAILEPAGSQLKSIVVFPEVFNG